MGLSYTAPINTNIKKGEHMILNVLVACEESQRVCTEFRKLGHNAFSCDLVDCSGNHPEWHFKQDALQVITNGGGILQNGKEHYINGTWDIVIAHPPCTHLAVSGAAWFEKKRADGRQKDGIEFFCQFLNIDCKYVMIENPIGIISGDYVKKWFPDLAEKYGLPKAPTQIIQPYMFGDAFEKKTCLWLKNLPQLVPTNIVQPPERTKFKSGITMPTWYAEAFKLKPEERAKVRSKTFPGIAKAIAEQWSEYVAKEKCKELAVGN